jgi:hypothetical protein
LQEEESTHTATLSLSRSDTSESSLWREVEEGGEEKRDGREGRGEMEGERWTGEKIITAQYITINCKKKIRNVIFK